VKGTPKERHFVELGERKDDDEYTSMQTFQISGMTDSPQIIEVPVSISAHGPRTFVLREKRGVKLDDELFIAAQKATSMGQLPALWIDWVEWEGPLVKQAPIAKVERIEPETRRADVERDHLRYKYLNEQYTKRMAAGGDEKRLKEFDPAHTRTASGELNRFTHLFDLRQKCLETKQAIFQKNASRLFKSRLTAFFSLHPTTDFLTETDKRSLGEI
jgi:hypothetical protein